MIKIFIIISFLIAIVSCNRRPSWYSDIDQMQIKTQDKEFFSHNDISDDRLIATLQGYKEAMINKNITQLYEYRTLAFRNIVSRSVYENEILGKTDLPNEVYFSNRDKIVTNETASLQVYYVYTNETFSYCIESTDIWTLEKDGKWYFSSNNTPWGTSIEEKPER